MVWGQQDAPFGTVALLDAPKIQSNDVFHYWIVFPNDPRCVVEEEEAIITDEEEIPDCSLAPPDVPTYYFSPKAPSDALCFTRVYTCFGDKFLGFQNAAPGTTGECQKFSQLGFGLDLAWIRHCWHTAELTRMFLCTYALQATFPRGARSGGRCSRGIFAARSPSFRTSLSLLRAPTPSATTAC